MNLQLLIGRGGNKNTFNVDDVGYASAAAAGLTGGDITPSGAVGTKQGFSIVKFTGPGLQVPGSSSWTHQKPNSFSVRILTTLEIGVSSRRCHHC